MKQRAITPWGPDPWSRRFRRIAGAFVLSVAAGLAVFWLTGGSGGDDHPVRGRAPLRPTGHTPTYPAAPKVALDVDADVRILAGNNRRVSAGFSRAVHVEAPSTIDVAAILQNPGTRSSPIARDVRLRIEIPQSAIPSLEITVEPTASNLGRSTGYNTFASVSVFAPQGQQLRVTSIYSFKLQHNDPTRAHLFNWQAPNTIPSDRIKVAQSATKSIYVISPSADGTLGPDPTDEVQVSFLVNVVLV